MRILTRYILREVFSHALLGGVLFTFVLFTPRLNQLLELIVRNSSSLVSVGEIILFMLPNMFVLTVPMSVLVGVLLGFSRLAADSEITAMRAAGMGVWRFVGIAGIVATLAFGFNLANSLFLAPAALRGSIALEDSLRNAQASFEVQPHVFYEDFKNIVLYVDDVPGTTGASLWHKVFMADISSPNNPDITTAESATVVDNPDGSVLMRLRNGAQQQLDPDHPDQYKFSTFSMTDLPLISDADETDEHSPHAPAVVASLPTWRLEQLTHAKFPMAPEIELQKRYAYPFACFVLMLVGVPLGMSSKRGGKSAGFVLTIALVFVYYVISDMGIALARQHKVPVFAGIWAANVIFGISGLALLRHLSRSGAGLPALPNIASLFKRFSRPRVTNGVATNSFAARMSRARRGFPLLLDKYVVAEFLKMFALVLITFLMLMLLFTFFELLGDIIRNRTPFIIVGEYLLNLTPSLVYLIAPLSVLIAGLVVFGGLNRTSEITAMKATGISVYRVVIPVLGIACVLAVLLFVFNETYIPGANRRQEALRAEIKGRPAQTFQRPEQKWMFGIEKPGKPSHIFYYQFFDQDQNRFANISVFTFKPGTFDLINRLYASSAQWDAQRNAWVFHDGWKRSLGNEEIGDFQTFTTTTIPGLPEQPQYFKKDPRLSSEMSFVELNHYVHELRQSGFDTTRLRVQLNDKLAYPLIALVMAMLAVPFALSMGRSGSLAGIAVAVGIAVLYRVLSSVLEAMGDVNMLPAMLAAWSPDLLFGLAGAYLLLRTPT